MPEGAAQACWLVKGLAEKGLASAGLQYWDAVFIRQVCRLN